MTATFTPRHLVLDPQLAGRALCEQGAARAVHVPRRDRLQPGGGGGGVRRALAVQLRDARRRRPAAGYGVAALCPFSSSAQALTACSACDSRVVAGTVPSTAQLRHLLHAALATCDLRVWLALSEFISCECLLE